MSRRRWAFVFAGAVALDVSAWLIGPALAGLVLLIPPLVIATVLVHWWWLARGSSPIVFVTLFQGRSKPGRQAAETHFGALAAFLRDDERLDAAGGVQVREIPVALTGSQADRLLRISGALMVIRGSGDAVADISRWEWWAHFRDQPPGIMIMRHEYSLRFNERRRSLIRRLKSVAPTAEVHDSEGGLALKSFVAKSVSIAHFGSLAAILCVLVNEFALGRATAARPVELALPKLDDASLPAAIAGRLLSLRAAEKLSQGKEHLAVLGELQASLRNGAGGTGFGIWLTNQWFAASVERRVAKSDALTAALEIVDRFPTDQHVLLNTAGMAIEARQFQLANDLADRAEDEEPHDPGIPRLRGNLAWAQGHPDLALSLYREASKTGPPQTWQMGDCFAALGKRSRALRCYRKVLRRDATAADALLHARALRRIPTLLPTMPGGWRQRLWPLLHGHPLMARPLLWLWRQRRPEDPWLPTWLARHALVVDDLEVARRWLILTTRKEGTNRLIVTIDALIVARLRREGDPDRGVQFLQEHMNWLDERLSGDVHRDAEAAIRLLAAARPDLLDTPEGPEIRAMFSRLSLGQAFAE